jgi:hypothetical protein
MVANSSGNFQSASGAAWSSAFGLLLQQRQVVQRIEHEVLALVGAGMARNHLCAAGDDDLVHVAAYQNLLMPVRAI